MLTILQDLNLPIEEIKKQAKGDRDAELLLAASYGYRLAIEDKTQFTQDK